MSPNRAVAVLTPLVFAPLAGTIAAFVAHNFPGVEISESSLTQIFIAGALIAFAKAAQWTRGWQKYEARHDVVAAAPADPYALSPLDEEASGVAAEPGPSWTGALPTEAGPAWDDLLPSDPELSVTGR